ncbi:MAG TPA: Spy/CpxP family protein refolding chaperone [Beijerinckiaceae bacterium]|nr:Spy/CpxP family protein refolding chaperone [Beijerinckiaceae bacterium]
MAALRTGLRLSADQDKLWPPVEEAMRHAATLRRDQMRAWREGRGRDSDDLPAMLRGLSERQLASGEALRKLADAAAPLYASLDEGQKRRLRVLARGLRPGRHGAMARSSRRTRLARLGRSRRPLTEHDAEK